MSCSSNSIFDSPNTYIKFQGSDLVSVEGANLLDRLLLNNVVIPFKQILKGRIILKPGQSNYLFNFLGLGDNATFVALVPKFDVKSVMEEDNYIDYVYATELLNTRSFKEIMILTGNSTHRVPQLYLSNPNTLYSVTIETMIAVIDENQTFFVDTANQVGVSYTNLSFTNIQTFEVGVSLVVYGKSISLEPPRPLTYLLKNTLSLINQQGNILIITDTSVPVRFLQFKTIYDANQASAAITYFLQNDNVYIGGDHNPIIYFKTIFEPSGDFIALNGLTNSAPYNSTEGLTFSSSTYLSYFTDNTITYTNIIQGAITRVFDGVSGDLSYLSLSSNNILIDGVPYSTGITMSGTYSISFNIGNGYGFYIDPNLKLNLTVN